MKCPIDGTQLVMTDRSGVEIDYCPQCRGVWLDRGELDKIIERSATQFGHAGRESRMKGEEYAHPRGRKKRAGSFLDDIFDF